MKLADKGPIKPPPVLKGPAQFVSLEIQSWPGIVAATHWFLYDQTQVDGADFYVGDRELGHIHLDGEIHLGTTRTLGAMLIEHGLADPFEWHDAWVQCPIRKKADVEHALWLFRLGYDRLTGTGIAILRRRVLGYRVRRSGDEGGGRCDEVRLDRSLSRRRRRARAAERPWG